MNFRAVKDKFLKTGEKIVFIQSVIILTLVYALIAPIAVVYKWKSRANAHDDRWSPWLNPSETIEDLRAQ